MDPWVNLGAKPGKLGHFCDVNPFFSELLVLILYLVDFLSWSFGEDKVCSPLVRYCPCAFYRRCLSQTAEANHIFGQFFFTLHLNCAGQFFLVIFFCFLFKVLRPIIFSVQKITLSLICIYISINAVLAPIRNSVILQLRACLQKVGQALSASSLNAHLKAFPNNWVKLTPWPWS